MQVSAFIRRAAADGGFATVLHKGDAISGSIMVVGLVRGANPRIYEKFPSLTGKSVWQTLRSDASLDTDSVQEIVTKRIQRDRDLWVIELDAADDERLNGLLPSGD
jgi:hypothetical protein